jgi:Uma2 family endonuclease
MITELLGGAVTTSPHPSHTHQDAILNLAVRLQLARPPEMRVLLGPFPLHVDPDNEVTPDLMVAYRCDLIDDCLIGIPLLVVEVQQAGNALIDRSTKKALYARHGVPSYWLVDTENAVLTVFRLTKHGRYKLTAEVEGDDRWHSTTPVSLTFSPVELTDGTAPD